MTVKIDRLRDFIGDFTRLVGDEPDRETVVSRGAALLGALVANDDWLPDAYAAPRPERYQQYLLHCDPLERFSVVSFVWGPGQRTPLHDHRVWGLIGMLRGSETETRYARTAGGRFEAIGVEALQPGDVATLSATPDDLHQVANAYPDRTSISIHVYGGNIGAVRRATYDAETGAEKVFISGYVNAAIPNLWDRSANPASL